MYGSGSKKLSIRRVIRGTDWSKRVLPQLKFAISPRIEADLATPSWSVSSLLPKNDPIGNGEVTVKDLHHLLKLSALPLPRDVNEEQKMLRTLASQIHFVKEVQKVDTTGVEPLVAIRDETEEARDEETITLDKLKPFLDKERRVGTNGTIRRQKDQSPPQPPSWDPFDLGGGSRDNRRVGKFFYVRKQKDIPAGD